MGLKKVSKLIEKINVLYDSLLSIDEEISSIEKDLLLNYIRQLYEQVLEIGTEEAPKKLAREVMDLPKREEVVVHPAVEEIADIPTEDSFKVPQPVMTTINRVETEQKVEVEQKVEQAVEVLDEPITMQGLNEDLVAMFEVKEAKELSEKLSNLPIKDLNTAMGINDRFLTVNELFAGDAGAFKECVDHINKLESYEDAKSYLLTNAAQTYDWSSAERLKKAAGFITLVQRRFK
ncbi:hypothetical protein [Portibacter lacus]|uniref:Uncharacterized protein n=1 Tax=Portibacter lacus TaxID=1099794 RepID=A0AA37SPJ2_9BACT|nr:hypothetical protein [Portibacter lacus]GLR16839.1 hypothetical protein GCM10007940_14540 [Portibacter lacus]